MFKLLPILLLLTSCVPDLHRAQARAVMSISRITCDVEKIEHNPNVVIFDTKKELNKKRFELTGENKTVCGFYYKPTKTIYLKKYGNSKVVKHEYEHYYLDQLGFPLIVHHDIMGIR